MSKNYIDTKITIWKRYHFSDNTDMQKIVNEINEAPENLHDILDIAIDGKEFGECEMLYFTEDLLTLDMNEGCATVEIFENDNSIWDNSYESEVKRKIN
jgi:hypothetical protein